MVVPNILNRFRYFSVNRSALLELVHSRKAISLFLLSCFTSLFSNQATAIHPDDLLPPDKAFELSTTLKLPNSLTLTWKIAEGYSLYRHKFEIVSITPEIRLDKASIPAGERYHDKNLGDVHILRNKLSVEIPFQRLMPSVSKLVLAIKFQGCADIGFCYMPIEKTLSIDLSEDNVNGVGSIQSPNSPLLYQSEQNRIADFMASHSFWLTVISFFGFGILLAFTPCIFPMLPIVAGIIAGQKTALKTKKAFWLSLSYVLASAFTYALIGIFSGLFGSNLQAAFQTPWVITSLSGLFVLLALSMWDVFHFQMPEFIQARLVSISAKHQGGTVMGAVVMGMLSALAIGPCVTAPLAGALIYIAKTTDAMLGGFALFALGLGMGTPLLIIGTFAGRFLPKAGAWMVRVKFFFGIGLLAVAIWLLGRILPANITLALWLLLAISPVLFLITKRRWKPASLLAITYGLILWLGFSSNQFGSISPLLCSVSVACEQKPQLAFKKIETLEELHQHLANARANKQWVMLDYYADWCVACLEMANDTFSDQKVQSALSKTILLQADVTDNSPADQALLKQFKLMGPPAILFFDPDQLERLDYRVMGFMKADEFMGILNRLLHERLS